MTYLKELIDYKETVKKADNLQAAEEEEAAASEPQSSNNIINGMKNIPAAITSLVTNVKNTIGGVVDSANSMISGKKTPTPSSPSTPPIEENISAPKQSPSSPKTNILNSTSRNNETKPNVTNTSDRGIDEVNSPSLSLNEEHEEPEEQEPEELDEPEEQEQEEQEQEEQEQEEQEEENVSNLNRNQEATNIDTSLKSTMKYPLQPTKQRVNEYNGLSEQQKLAMTNKKAEEQLALLKNEMKNVTSGISQSIKQTGGQKKSKSKSKKKTRKMKIEKERTKRRRKNNSH